MHQRHTLTLKVSEFQSFPNLREDLIRERERKSPGTVTPVGSAWDIGGRINEVKLYAYVTSMQKHALI
jgi:hypothetical protein